MKKIIKIVARITVILLAIIGLLSLVLFGAICYKVDVKGEPVNINIAPSPHVVLDKYVEKLQAHNDFYADTISVKMTSNCDSIRAAEIFDYFRLDTLYTPKSSTWEKTLAIAKFVAKNIPHNNQRIQPDSRDAITLWEYTKNVEPAFNCRLHSILTFELLQAAGIEARFITCMPEDKNEYDCHVVNHVWLPELDKWAMIDSDSGGNWASDSNGTPLSIPELRDYYIYGKDIYFHPEFGASSCKKSHYYGYMAKNTFWFSCWETHQFSQEPSDGRNVGRYISLVPKGYEPFGLNQADIVIHNAEQFWAAPSNKRN